MATEPGQYGMDCLIDLIFGNYSQDLNIQFLNILYLDQTEHVA